MKIIVYAICKNEEHFVDRWYESMKEADEIYVTDTGSTDNTIEKLKEHSIIVNSADIKPWRFDKARNISLSYVPNDADICVCTDLDEVFDKGWRNELEKEWKKDTTKAKYKYEWDTNGTSFWIEKIHKRHGFKWVHPVHEVLEYDGVDSYITCNGITLRHFPDKTKSRGQYLQLLEMSVKEAPNDDRNMHYLGREYMFYKQYDKCIETLQKHLAMPNAKWLDERCASMRYIARSFLALNDEYNAKIWYYRAIAEAPYLREPYIELAKLAYKESNWEMVIFLINEALKIKERPKTYINESFCWNSLPYDIASIAYYNMGLYEKALEYAEKAYEISPDSRIENNIKIIKGVI